MVEGRGGLGGGAGVLCVLLVVVVVEGRGGLGGGAGGICFRYSRYDLE